MTRRLAIAHPVLLAPMDLVADAALTTAVSRAGGLGILGGGYGEEAWLTRELDRLADAQVRYGVGFITWSLATQPRLLDLVLERRPAAVMLSFGDPAPFAERIRRAGAALICQVQSLAMAKEAAAAGADILVTQGTEGARTRRNAQHVDAGAGGRRRARRAGPGGRRRRPGRRSRPGRSADARCLRRADGNTLLSHP